MGIFHAIAVSRRLVKNIAAIVQWKSRASMRDSIATFSLKRSSLGQTTLSLVQYRMVIESRDSPCIFDRGETGQ